ncbi:MAG: hypothetical protein ACAH17_00255 [Candidatus Paceibacterota bacterium]
MRIKNEDILDIDGTRATVSLAASANLKPLWIGQSALAAIQLIYTGTPAGNFKLQGSCDPGQPNAQSEAQQYAGVSNWTDVTSTTTISAAGSTMYNIADPGYYWVRVVWTATGAGSTPVLTQARCVTKGI